MNWHYAKSMNALTKISKSDIDFTQCGHWLHELPYRAVIAVAVQSNHGTVLYQVAGTSDTPRSAAKALKIALDKHGGSCFYCKTTSASDVTVEMTLDHIEPRALGGNSEITNLVVACKPCNAKKGHILIDAFNPHATELWLRELATQIEQRFDRLKSNPKPSQPRPSPDATTGL
jgi:5-methylcytosine-specific restriction endonuclease McrA